MEPDSVGQLLVGAGDLALRERCWGRKLGSYVRGEKNPNLRHVVDKGACRDQRKRDGLVEDMKSILRSIVDRYWQGKTSRFKT